VAVIQAVFSRFHNGVRVLLRRRCNLGLLTRRALGCSMNYMAAAGMR